MQIQIKDKEIRIIGERGVDLRIYASSSEKSDSFRLSLCYDGFEHGCLPMVEVSGDKNIIVTNNLKTGRYLLNGRED